MLRYACLMAAQSAASENMASLTSSASASSLSSATAPSVSSSSSTPGRARAVISVVGKDRAGIIAGITAILADSGANILDISQTILDGFFTMMAIVDISHVSCSFADLADSLAKAGAKLGVDVRCQREEIFTSMERI
jgi:ACT domain-containing protein